MSTLSLRDRCWAEDGTAPRRFGQIVRNEARLALRRPVGLIGGVAMPIVLLIIFSQLPAFQQTLPGLGGDTIFAVYVPVLMCFGLAMLALLGLPIPLVSYRELGHPAPPVDHPGSAVVAAGRAGRRPAGHRGDRAGHHRGQHRRLRGTRPEEPRRAGPRVLLAAAGLFAIGLLISALARTSGAAERHRPGDLLPADVLRRPVAAASAHARRAA